MGFFLWLMVDLVSVVAAEMTVGVANSPVLGGTARLASLGGRESYRDWRCAGRFSTVLLLGGIIAIAAKSYLLKELKSLLWD